MGALPVLSTGSSFQAASRVVIDLLVHQIPFGMWAVTQLRGPDQVWLTVSDDLFGRQAGDVSDWQSSLCRQLVTGDRACIVTDLGRRGPTGVEVPADVGSYAGAALRWADGELFGTICGLDSRVHDASLLIHQPLLESLASLLSAVLIETQRAGELSQQLDAARMLSQTDSMTELANRRGWDRYLQAEEDRYRRFGDPAAVLVIDLDELKSINDSYGHAAGDAHIVRASRTLNSTVRVTDFIARLGGDEFGVVAARTTPEQAAILVRRLRAALRIAGIRASIGYATVDIADGFVGTWQRADALMYADKRTRRRRSWSKPG